MLTDVIDIDGYYPLKAPPGTSDNVHFMSRADARKVYDNTIAKIPERIDLLGRLCEQNGYTNDPAGWTKLVDEHVVTEIDEDGSTPLDPIWNTIVLDISLAMSQLLIERSNGQLEWKFYTGSKNSFDYQRPVLVGFSKAVKTYHLGLFLPLTNMARRAATGKPMRDLDEYLDYIADDI